MPDSTAELSLFGRLKAEYGKKGLRYVAVSAFNVVFGQSLLILANSVIGWRFVPSTLFSVTVSAGPAYFLSRNWVWEKRGKSHFMREVVPFWALAIAGASISLILAEIAQNYADTHGLSSAQGQVLLNFTNLFAFGIVWVAKFFILDKILFKDEPLTDDSFDALVDEVLHHETD